MIKIMLADDKNKVTLGLTESAFVVKDGENIVGYCQFKMTPPEVFLIKADCEDKLLLDGLLRQTLSFSLDHDCPTAKFTDEVKEKLFLLKIIKKFDVDNLDILEFFTKLNGCEIF